MVADGAIPQLPQIGVTTAPPKRPSDSAIRGPHAASRGCLRSGFNPPDWIPPPADLGASFWWQEAPAGGLQHRALSTTATQRRRGHPTRLRLRDRRLGAWLLR